MYWFYIDIEGSLCIEVVYIIGIIIFVFIFYIGVY